MPLSLSNKIKQTTHYMDCHQRAVLVRELRNEVSRLLAAKVKAEVFVPQAMCLAAASACSAVQPGPWSRAARSVATPASAAMLAELAFRPSPLTCCLSLCRWRTPAWTSVATAACLIFCLAVVRCRSAILRMPLSLQVADPSRDLSHSRHRHALFVPLATSNNLSTLHCILQVADPAWTCRAAVDCILVLDFPLCLSIYLVYTSLCPCRWRSPAWTCPAARWWKLCTTCWQQTASEQQMESMECQWQRYRRARRRSVSSMQCTTCWRRTASKQPSSSSTNTADGKAPPLGQRQAVWSRRLATNSLCKQHLWQAAQDRARRGFRAHAAANLDSSLAFFTIHLIRGSMACEAEGNRMRWKPAHASRNRQL